MNLPKRRRIKDNPYILGLEHLLTFIDSRGKKQTIKISDELYNEFNNFELLDLKQLNEFDRHIEHLELSDENLYKRAKNAPRLLEDIVLEKIILERLYQEIDKLPSIQRRRLKMYYFDNMSFESIAEKEKCSPRAIKYSTDLAIRKISQNLKNSK